MRIPFLVIICLFIIACSNIQSAEVMLKVADGKDLYKRHCANCHQEDGSGLADLIPPLKDSDYLKTHIHELKNIVFNGSKGNTIVNGKMFNLAMPGNHLISEEQYQHLEIYIRLHFLNQKEILNQVQ